MSQTKIKGSFISATLANVVAWLGYTPADNAALTTTNTNVASLTTAQATKLEAAKVPLYGALF